MSLGYENLWVEKYRPKKLEDVVLSDKNRKEMLTFSDSIPHLLFCGKCGIGKTTLAKILINDVLKCQYLYINASNETGIDTIRTKVINFAQIRSMDGNKKVVFLDEMDAMSGSAMRILRNVMEEYSETTRFILTANYFSKIIEPIRSRCIIINLTPDIKGMVSRCFEILKAENIDTKEDLPKLVDFVKDRYPDMRRIINDLQKSCLGGKLVISDQNKTENFSKNLWEKIKKGENSLTLRSFLIQSESDFDSDYQNLYKSLFEIIYNEKLEDSKKKSILLEIGESSYRDNFVVDHELNFFCFLINLETLIKA